MFGEKSDRTNVVGTICYWEGVADPKKLFNGEQGEAIFRVINKLLTGDSRSADLDLKRARGYKLYGVRLNVADRVLFTTVWLDNKPHILLLDLILNHDYQKSWVLKPAALRAFIKKNQGDFHTQSLSALGSEDFEKIDELPEEDRPEPCVTYHKKSLRYFQNRFIHLTTVQEAALEGHFPLLVRGAAGSGKSFVAYAILEQQLAFIRANPTLFSEKSSILFAAKSSALIKHFKSQWVTSPHTANATNTDVFFKDYDELVKEAVSKKRKETAEIKGSEERKEAEENESNQTNYVGFDTFEKWLGDNQKRLGNIHLTAHQLLYNEFKLIAACEYLNQDYLQLGQRESRLSKNTQQMKLLIQLYQDYRIYLAQHDFIDTSFIVFESDGKYDLIIVDEVQDLSRLQILSLSQLAKNKKICMCMDTNQALTDGLSDLNFIKQLFADSSLFLVNLEKSHRTPPAIARFSSLILKIKNYICGGVLHEGEYCQHQSLLDEEGAIKLVEPKEAASLATLTALPNTAVVIPHQDYLAEAKAIFKTALIFTAEEIKGLEYPNIIAYKLIDGKRIKTINQALSAISSLDEIAVKENRPKEKETMFNHEQDAILLNNLFVALTRATRQLFLVTEKTPYNHYLRPLLQREILPSLHELPTERPQEEANWEEEHKRLKEHGLTQQADELYKKINVPKDDNEPSLVKDARKKKSKHKKKKEDIKTIASTPSENPTRTGTKNAAKAKECRLFIEGFLTLSDPKLIKENLESIYRNKHFLRIMFETQVDGKILIEHLFINAKFRDIFVEWVCERDNENKELIKFYHGIQATPLVFEGYFKNKALQQDAGLLFLLSFCQLDDCSALIELEFPRALMTCFLRELGSSVFPKTNDSLLLRIVTKQVFSAVIHKISKQIISEESLYKVRPRDNESVFYWLVANVQGRSIFEKLLATYEQLFYFVPIETLCAVYALNNTSAFYWLTVTNKGRIYLEKLLARNERLLSLIPIETLCALHKTYNTSAFYWLVITSNGRAILEKFIAANERLLSLIPPAVWWERNKGDNSSLLYWLIGNQEGAAFLERAFTANDQLLSLIPQETWWAVDKSYHASPLYWLFVSQDGRQFLDRVKAANEQLFTSIPLDTLCAIYKNHNTSLFYWLTASMDGRVILEKIMAANEQFFSLIPVEILCTPYKTDNTSALYWMMANSDGRAILEKLMTANEQLLTSIPVETLSTIHEPYHSSVLYWLAAPDGQAIFKKLIAANEQLLSRIPAETWCAVKNSNKTSPLFWLAGSTDGRTLLEKLIASNEQLPSVISFEALCTLTVSENTSLLYWLAACTKGRELLEKVVSVNEGLLSLIPIETLCARFSDNTSPLFWLAANMNGRAILKKLFDANEKLLPLISLEVLSGIYKIHNASAFHWLAAGEDGRAILEKLFAVNPTLFSLVPRETWSALDAADNSSIFYWLGAASLSLLEKLLAANEHLMAWISLDVLCAIHKSHNSALLFWLAANPKGRALLEKLVAKDERLLSLIPVETWYALNNEHNTSAIYWVSAVASGREMFEKLIAANERVLSLMPVETLCAINRNDDSSMFYWLLASKNGVGHLERIVAANERLLALIPLETLCVTHKTSNLSVLHCLTATSKGRALLEKILSANTELLSLIPVEAWCAMNKNESASALYYLASNLDGRVLLAKLISPDLKLSVSLQQKITMLMEEATDQKVKNTYHFALWVLREVHGECTNDPLPFDINDNAIQKWLSLSASAGFNDTLRLLLARDNNKFIDVIYGQEPLLFSAASSDHEATVSFLLAQKANPDLACTNSATPIFIAAQNGNQKIVALLLKYKADPTIPFVTTEFSLRDFSRGRGEIIAKNIEAYIAKNKDASNDGESKITLLPADIAMIMGYPHIAAFINASIKKCVPENCSQFSIFSSNTPTIKNQENEYEKNNSNADIRSVDCC